MAFSSWSVDIEPTDPDKLARLRACITQAGFGVEPEGGGLRVLADPAEAGEINVLAMDAGIVLSKLVARAETLEDVFLRMTGGSNREAGEAIDRSVPAHQGSSMTGRSGHRPPERGQPPKAKRTLIGAIRSETTRLNRPTFAGVGSGLMAFFALFGTLIAFLFGDGLQEATMPPGMGFPITLESARGLVAGLSMSADLIGIVALSL